jgi:hypothetical protein
MEQLGSSTLPKPNDGVVPLSSVESQEYFINLGHSKSCHTNLMSDYEYGLAKEVLVEGGSNQTGSQQPQQPSQQHQQQEKQKGSQQQKIQNSGISLDLTTPTASNLYGGDKKGSLDFSVQNNNMIGTAEMNEQPTDGNVYEGWFEDKGDASGYSLSVGKFNDENTLAVNQTMVNPYTYTVFFVTVEPIDDPDPNPSNVVVGTKLPIPYGQ